MDIALSILKYGLTATAHRVPLLHNRSTAYTTSSAEKTYALVNTSAMRQRWVVERRFA